METWSGDIDRIFAGLALVLASELTPWVLLLVLLIARPPLLREIILARKAGHAQRYRHLLNMMRFRAELAKRRGAASAPRSGPWL